MTKEKDSFPPSEEYNKHLNGVKNPTGVPDVFDDEEFQKTMGNAFFLQELLEIPDQDSRIASTTEDFEMIFEKECKESIMDHKDTAEGLLLTLKPVLRKYKKTIEDPKKTKARSEVYQGAVKYIAFLKGVCNKGQEDVGERIYGLACNLGDDQIKNLYPFVNSEFFNCSERSFKAMLYQGVFPSDVPRPIWALTRQEAGKEVPHGGALRDFLKLVGVNLGTGKTEINCIVDKNSDPIEIPPHHPKPTRFYKKIIIILEKVKIVPKTET